MCIRKPPCAKPAAFSWNVVDMFFPEIGNYSNVNIEKKHFRVWENALETLHRLIMKISANATGFSPLSFENS